jgi:protein-tyrosine phosphatase
MGGPAFVDVDGLTNVRDLGGYRNPGGAVRRGLVYRADSPHLASEAGIASLRALGIVSVYDLRSAPERDEHPGPLPSAHHPIHDDVTVPGLEPRAASGREGGEAILRDFYVRALREAAPRYGVVLTALADRDRLPALVHCMGGKDRTGVAVALLLSTLGVDRETVLDDYAHVPPGDAHRDRREMVLAIFQEQGIATEVALGMLSTPRWAMADALAGVDAAYGSVDAYLVEACGMAPRTLEVLRATLVE